MSSTGCVFRYPAQVLLFLAGLASFAAQAVHPLITEDTGTQGRGGWQLEVNAEKTRDQRDGATIRDFQPAETLSYGALNNVDLQITPAYVRQQSDGVSIGGKLDTALDAKWRFYDEGSLSFGLKPGITLPTGRDDESRGAGRTTWGSLAILSYDREHWALHSHAGYRHNRNTRGERKSFWHISAALWLKPTEALKVVVDRSYDTNPDPSSSTTLRQTVFGIIYPVTPQFDLDAGVRLGNGPVTDRALLLGATLRW